MTHILNKFFDKIYVITLPNSIRIPRIISRLTGIDYEFYYGINGATLDKTPYIEMGSKQTRGQLGCTLSHYNLYKKIISDNMYEKILIIEDDAILTDNLNNLEIYLNQLPEDWGLFYLGWGGHNLPTNYSENLCEVSQTNFHSVHCTHAIAIKPWFAEKLIESNKNMLYTADGNLSNVVKEYNLKTYAAVPTMIDPDNIDSITCYIDKQYGF